MNLPLSSGLPRLRQLAELDDRSREIFRLIVESYLATGEPTGSKTLARILPIQLSSASIRNVMAELEEAFGAPVIEAYGMTEAAHQMASNPLPPGAPPPGARGPAGRAAWAR